MKLTDEELLEVEGFAGALLTPTQISIVMDLDLQLLKDEINDHESPISKAYYRGRLKTIVEVQNSAITWAKRGSTPALTQVFKIIDDSNLKLSIR